MTDTARQQLYNAQVAQDNAQNAASNAIPHERFYAFALGRSHGPFLNTSSSTPTLGSEYTHFIYPQHYICPWEVL